MDDFKKLWGWLVTSSADPRNTSLAVKGALVYGGGYLLQAIQLACTAGLACLPLDSDLWSTFIDVAGAFTEGSLMALGAVITVIGFIRKWQNGRWTAAE